MKRNKKWYQNVYPAWGHRYSNDTEANLAMLTIVGVGLLFFWILYSLTPVLANDLYQILGICLLLGLGFTLARARLFAMMAGFCILVGFVWIFYFFFFKLLYFLAA